MSYLDYFNRAMVFAQTNYQENLSKLSKLNFRNLTPSNFFEEYAWCVCTTGMSAKTVSKYFQKLIPNLQPYFKSFWDYNSFPEKSQMEKLVLPVVHNQQKCDALWSGAKIINNGVKLFTWDKYRDHYLNDAHKLQAFPSIGSINSNTLSRNIGLVNVVIGDTHLNRMAARWGFENADVMCKTISNSIVLQPRVIGLILWYSAATFGTNIPES